nr:hypothetical protein [Pararhodobacter sp.]
MVSCARLAQDIPDFGAFETHEAYVARLKKERLPRSWRGRTRSSASHGA